MEAVQDFLQSFFPIRSQFELDPGLRNRFLHMSDLRAWQEQQRRMAVAVRIMVSILLLGAMFLFFGQRLQKLRQCWVVDLRRSCGLGGANDDATAVARGRAAPGEGPADKAHAHQH